MNRFDDWYPASRSNSMDYTAVSVSQTKLGMFLPEVKVGPAS
jgi:hypothetical protein